MSSTSIVVTIFLGAFKEAGKASVSELLANIKEHNDADTYEQTLKAGSSFFTLLSKVAAKSKTKIDDGVIEIFLSPIQDAADADDITL